MKQSTGIMIGVAAFFAIGNFMVWLGGKVPASTDHRRQAYRMCTDTMLDKLKAPATADFLSYRDNLVTVTTGDNGETVFGVVSYVDAQNSFGAKIRTKFICGLSIPRGGSTLVLTGFSQL